MPFPRPSSASLTALTALTAFVAALALCAPALAAPRWLMVSDIHLDPAAHYDTLASAGHDSDDALFRSTVAAMVRADRDAPVVIVSGDLLAHGFRGDALSTMRRIAGILGTAFPHAQFVYALGNNDDPCGDYHTGIDTPYMHALAQIWEPLVNRSGASPDFIRDFGRSGYYTARLPGDKVRAVVLNSVAWSWLYHPCNPQSVDPGTNELQWLDATLAQPSVRSLLVMHIPPGVDARWTAVSDGLFTIPLWNAAEQAAFVTTVTHRRAHIAGMLAAHEHRDDVRFVDGIPIYIVGSVSPIAGNAPAFYTLDAASDGTVSVAAAYRYAQDRWSQGPGFTSGFPPVAIFARCAQQVGGDYEACVGTTRRRIWFAAFLAAIAAGLWLLWRAVADRRRAQQKR